jgi:hypothetical protein
LPDDKVFSASMALGTEHRDRFAAARVKGIADPNLKSRTPGSMTLFRLVSAKAGWLVHSVKRPAATTARSSISACRGCSAISRSLAAMAATLD